MDRRSDVRRAKTCTIDDAYDTTDNMDGYRNTTAWCSASIHSYNRLTSNLFMTERLHDAHATR